MKYKQYTTKERAAFCATKTLRQIADEIGRNIDSVRHHAKRYGLDYKLERPRSTDLEIGQAIACYMAGKSVAEAASELNRGKTWVKSIYARCRNEAIHA